MSGDNFIIFEGKTFYFGTNKIENEFWKAWG